MAASSEMTKGISAVEFATAMRVHNALTVTNLERSLPFYQTLFRQEPTKLRPDYAKFEVAEPPINLTLNVDTSFTPTENKNVSHFGIQVKSTDEVLAFREHFVASGLTTFDEENVTCCYAVQDKVWVTDPDGNEWEIFVVLDGDAPVNKINTDGSVSDACCTPGAAASVSKIEFLR